jgi:hypothetical protein
MNVRLIKFIKNVMINQDYVMILNDLKISKDNSRT